MLERGNIVVSSVVILCPKCDGELIIEAPAFNKANQLECPYCGNIFPKQAARIKSGDFKKCVACGKDVPKDSRECPYCNKKFLTIKGSTIECPYCAEEISRNAILCPHCNKNLKRPENHAPTITPKDVIASLSRDTKPKKQSKKKVLSIKLLGLCVLIALTTGILWQPEFTCIRGDENDYEKAKKRVKLLDANLSQPALSYKDSFIEADLNAYITFTIKERRELFKKSFITIHFLLFQLKQDTVNGCLKITIYGVPIHITFDGIPMNYDGAFAFEVKSARIGFVPMINILASIVLQKIFALDKIFEEELNILNKANSFEMQDGKIIIGRAIAQTVLIQCVACQGKGTIELRELHSLKSKSITCPVCNGTPKREITSTKQICPNCGGFGKIIVRSPQYKTMESQITATNCPVCGGSGFRE